MASIIPKMATLCCDHLFDRRAMSSKWYGFFFFLLHLQWQTPNKEFLNLKPTLSWKENLKGLVSTRDAQTCLKEVTLWLSVFDKQSSVVDTSGEIMYFSQFLYVQGFLFQQPRLSKLHSSFEIMCATFELWIASSYLGSGTGLSPILWETSLQFQILWTA